MLFATSISTANAPIKGIVFNMVYWYKFVLATFIYTIRFTGIATATPPNGFSRCSL
jgi:hypothetical protein